MTSTSSDESAAPPLYTTLRILSLLVLVLMLVAIVYAGWIALVNWGAIKV